jgi:hypothetical protein
MLPLAPVQRRSIARLKSGRAIVVERAAASPAVSTDRATAAPISEKRTRNDRRQRILPVENDRRHQDRRRTSRRLTDKRLKSLLDNSEQPVEPVVGSLLDTSA